MPITILPLRPTSDHRPTCEYCQKRYTPHQQDQRFCTKVCSNNWWRDTRALGVKILQGKEYD